MSGIKYLVVNIMLFTKYSIFFDGLLFIEQYIYTCLNRIQTYIASVNPENNPDI